MNRRRGTHHKPNVVQITDIPRRTPANGDMHEFRCDRCNDRMSSHGPATECQLCVKAARAVWPDAQPINGQVSGA